ncbi:MAG: single-stranded-DNA-specific exonuclease RecJ [Rhodospirillaceae bacterium]|nr:single-stranded-DNA-specific exonuclease RecJ [Rhodospirillaceae bacterium]
MLIVEERSKTLGSSKWLWPDNTHRVLRQVFARRNIKSPSEMSLSLSELRPVSEFEALNKGVELLMYHQDNPVIIVGDFDADGATSTALMVLCLRLLGFTDVSFFIPDRFELGYGLTEELVDKLPNKNPGLIVTVDNGITSKSGVHAARESGFDVLITDHHLPGAELPNANVIINPNLVGELFAGKSLAGVGVAFYLLAALEHHLGISRVVSGFLDLVALGTIADLVKLDHSNRILIEQGVARIRTGSCRPGIIALCEVVDKSQHELTATTLAYYIAPLLNAAGRLDDMSLGVRCLLTDSQKEAQNLAKKLDRLNKDRRNKTTRMRSEALDLVEAEATISVTDLAPIICLSRDDWHEGIVGLVASGIKDKYHRPTFAFARTNEGLLKGSGRSISGFHLRDALVAVDALHPGLIGRFGGHSMAAGLTLRPDGYLQFREAIQSFGEKSLEATDFHQKILTDGVLLDDDLTVEVASMLQNVGPWGQGFPEPLFEGVFILTDQRLLKDRHLKMIVKNLTNGASFDAIAFNFSESSLEVGESLHLVYRLSINDYYTTRRVQLIVEHMQQSENVIM